MRESWSRRLNKIEYCGPQVLSFRLDKPLQGIVRVTADT
jgi:hypothetical protein